eukprot:2755738-Amphidinium_carterae.1
MPLADKGKQRTGILSTRQKNASSKGATSIAGSDTRTGAPTPMSQGPPVDRTAAMQHKLDTSLDELPLTHLLSRVCSTASHGAPQNLMVSDDESMDSQGSGHCHRHVIERAQRRKRRKQDNDMSEGSGTASAQHTVRELSMAAGEGYAGTVVDGPTRPAPTKEEMESKRLRDVQLPHRVAPTPRQLPAQPPEVVGPRQVKQRTEPGQPEVVGPRQVKQRPETGVPEPQGPRQVKRRTEMAGQASEGPRQDSQRVEAEMHKQTRTEPSIGPKSQECGSRAPVPPAHPPPAQLLTQRGQQVRQSPHSQQQQQVPSVRIPQQQ